MQKQILETQPETDFKDVAASQGPGKAQAKVF
jgi:hypothetical protein